MAHLDELDTALLRELQRDARRTNRDLATAVGVAPTTALDRTRSLRQRGVIRGALLDVDLAAIGRPVQALIAVRIRPPSRRNIEAFRDWAARLPDTVGVFVVSGSEDFLLDVRRGRQPASLPASSSTSSPNGPRWPTSALASSTSTCAIPPSSPIPPSGPNPQTPAGSRCLGRPDAA